MAMYDKNGVELAVGDHIVPDEGREIVITSIGEMEGWEGEVVYGYQAIAPEFSSIIPQDNLSLQWTKFVAQAE